MGYRHEGEEPVNDELGMFMDKRFLGILADLAVFDCHQPPARRGGDPAVAAPLQKLTVIKWTRVWSDIS
jgi:hypothetical protein